MSNKKHFSKYNQWVVYSNKGEIAYFKNYDDAENLWAILVKSGKYKDKNGFNTVHVS